MYLGFLYVFVPDFQNKKKSKIRQGHLLSHRGQEGTDYKESSKPLQGFGTCSQKQWAIKENSFEISKNKPVFKYNFTSTQFPQLYNRYNKVTTSLDYDENKANVNEVVQHPTPN